MHSMTIYLDWISGQWEAYYPSDGETRRFKSWNQAEALKKAFRSTGYDERQIKVVRLDQPVPR